MTDTFFAPLELKFADGAPAGVFTGYGAVFGNEDSHGDVIKPGAFAQSIAERKAAGRTISMHLMHGFYGGDGVPVGVWKSIEEDPKGLRVEGKISGMNTDAGRLLFERVKDGALGGLSIGYLPKKGGVVYGEGKDEPKRTLTNIDLREISLVDDPSNSLARVDQVKSALVEEIKNTLRLTDTDAASRSLAAAMALHAETLSGQNSPTSEQRAQMLTHMQDAHEALTGRRQPAGMKSMPSTVREMETLLRERLGFSRSQARAIAEHGFKAASSLPRDEGDDQAVQPADFLQALLSG